ncbi:hypothetical protein IPC390_00145 [Pseudomonas aeruginosa]|nr:hypothetical protein IPC390_00145 [Pseudomonas aeruginosa]
MSGRIAARLVEHSQPAAEDELETLLATALKTGTITSASAQRMQTLMQAGLLHPDMALQRLRAIVSSHQE